MDENQDRVKIRARVKESIPEGERKGLGRRHDTVLWIIATVFLGVCLGYLVADQLLNVFNPSRVEYAPPDESVIRASKEKMILELEDLSPTQAPVSAPENP